MAARRRKPAPPPAWLVDGAIVDYHSIIGRGVTRSGLKVIGEPWQLGSGDWIVKLGGIPGGVSVEAISLPSYDVAADRAIIAVTHGGDGAEQLALGEAYDYGEASRGKPNGAIVHDVLTEPTEGAAMYERCLPDHAAFVIAAWTRWPAAVNEIERLQAELAEARRGR